MFLNFLCASDPINVYVTQVMSDGNGDISHFVRYVNAMPENDQSYYVVLFDTGYEEEDRKLASKVQFFEDMRGKSSVLSRAEDRLIVATSRAPYIQMLKDKVGERNIIMTCISSQITLFSNGDHEAQILQGPIYDLNVKLICYVPEHGGGNYVHKLQGIHSNPFARILGFPGLSIPGSQTIVRREGVFLDDKDTPHEKQADKLIVSGYVVDLSKAFFKNMIMCVEKSPLAKRDIEFNIVAKSGNLDPHTGSVLGPMPPADYNQLLRRSHISFCKPDASLEDAIRNNAFILFNTDYTGKATDLDLIDVLEITGAFPQTVAALKAVSLMDSFTVAPYSGEYNNDFLMTLMPPHFTLQEIDRSKTYSTTCGQMYEEHARQVQSKINEDISRIVGSRLTEGLLVEWQTQVVPWLKKHYDATKKIPLWEEQKHQLYHAIFDDNPAVRETSANALFESLERDELEGLCSILLLHGKPLIKDRQNSYLMSKMSQSLTQPFFDDRIAPLIKAILSHPKFSQPSEVFKARFSNLLTSFGDITT